MATYFANAPVSVTVDFVDGSGTPITPDSATFRVLDQQGYEVMPSAPILELDGSSVQIEIPATANELAYGDARGFRQVEVSFVYGGKLGSTLAEYLLESADALFVAKNSFQTYGEAQMTAADLTDVESFKAADRSDRIAALVNAFVNLTSMRFTVGCWRGVNLAQLNEQQFAQLPAHFLRRLKMAQVVEANEAMDYSSVHKKRQSGLMSETIGESSMMFRSEKVLQIPVTRRSVDLLRSYLSWEVSIGRG